MDKRRYRPVETVRDRPDGTSSRIYTFEGRSASCRRELGTNLWSSGMRLDVVLKPRSLHIGCLRYLVITSIVSLSSCTQSTIKGSADSVQQPSSTFEGYTYACAGAMQAIVSSRGAVEGDRRIYLRYALRELRSRKVNSTVESYLVAVRAVIDDVTRPINDVDVLECR